MIYSHYSDYMGRAMQAARPGPSPTEWAYLRPYLESNEQPFLELACGNGRLLLHIMEAGYNIVGVDSSPEMLAICRETGKKKSLQPVVHQQFMQRFSLDETFGFIFIDDCTFALVIEDADVHELFERVWRHLKPGGTFLFDFYPIDPNAKKKENEFHTCWVKAPDGTIYFSKCVHSYDPETHIATRLQMHDCYVDGKFVGSQAYEDPNRDHDTSKIIEQLSTIGFVDIRLAGYETEEPPAENVTMLSLRCKKPV